MQTNVADLCIVNSDAFPPAICIFILCSRGLLCQLTCIFPPVATMHILEFLISESSIKMRSENNTMCPATPSISQWFLRLLILQLLHLPWWSASTELSASSCKMERNIIPTCSNLEATHFGGKSQLLPERHSLPQPQQLRRASPNDLICFQLASSDTYNQIMCMRIGILILTHGDNSFWNCCDMSTNTAPFP